MPDKHVNQSVKIVMLPGAERAVWAAEESKAVRKVVMDNLLLSSMKPYHKVQVTVKRGTGAAAEAIVAYMLRAHTYTADVAMVKVGPDYAVKSIDLSYVAAEEDTFASIAAPPAVTKKSVRATKQRPVLMAFGTPVPEIATASAAVEYLYKLATRLGYPCVKLLGASANLANYRRYLGGHLLAFVNVGHGNTTGIALSDGFLSSSWFGRLPAKSLWPEVIYFNSCQTFNPPLLPAIEKAGRRTYVAGKVNLLIGASEEVCKCFWTKTLKAGEWMGRSLVACERAKYPNPNSHGISGDKGKFKPIP